MLVVYGHVARGLFNAGIVLDPVWYARLDAFIYTFHMPLFFWVSGYLYFFSIQKKTTLVVLQDKFRTVAYLYVVWSVLHGLVEVLMSHYTNGQLTLGAAFTLWHPRAHFWFLYVLFLIFVVATLVYRFKSRWVTVAALVAAMLLYQYRGVLGGGYLLAWLSPWLVYFAAGVAMAHVRPLVVKPVGLLLAAALGTLALATQLPLLWASFGVICVLVLSQWLDAHTQGLTRSTLMYLGQLSLPIYLMHVLAGSGIRIVLQKFFDLQNPWLHGIVGIAFGLVVPVLIYRLSVRYRWKALWALPPR